MTNADYPHFDYQLAIPKTLDERFGSLRAEILAEPVSTFERSIRDLTILLALPHTLLWFGTMLFDGALEASSQLQARRSEGEFKTEKEYQEAAFSLGAEGVRRVIRAEGPTIDLDRIRQSLDLVLEASMGVRSLLGLCKTAVLFAWAAYESLAGDVWVACLNAHPIPFAENALRVNRDPNAPIDGKTVRTYLLYQHDFDLRNKMGSILRDKYKFTNTSGICRAYVDAFGEQHRSQLKDIVGGDDLNFLEAARHNLAHHAVVDAVFLAQAKNYPGFDAIEGGPLVLSGSLTSRLLSAAVESAGRLLEFVDERIAEVA